MAADLELRPPGSAPRRGVVEDRFRAMGTDVHLIVVGGPPDAREQARNRIEQLEPRWSRFRPDSELSRLNTAGGRWLDVSDDTRLLLRRAVQGWRLTGGAFDPTTLPALERAGYDRSFELLPEAPPGAATGATAARPPGDPSPGLAGYEEDAGGRVRLPAGVRVDPGGIGKGLAADLVVADLIDAGAAGALVNLGGDLRAAGRGPDGCWPVELAPVDEPLGTVCITDAGVATSTRTRRVWWHGGGWTHHLLDPRTGVAADAPLVAATVIARDGWTAEILTKVVLLRTAPAAATLLGAAGATALAVDTHGTTITFDGLELV